MFDRFFVTIHCADGSGAEHMYTSKDEFDVFCSTINRDFYKLVHDETFQSPFGGVERCVTFEEVTR